MAPARHSSPDLLRSCKVILGILNSPFLLRKPLSEDVPEVESEDSSVEVAQETKAAKLLAHAVDGFMLIVACLSPSDRHYEENLLTEDHSSICLVNWFIELVKWHDLRGPVPLPPRATLAGSRGASHAPPNIPQATVFMVFGAFCPEAAITIARLELRSMQ